MILIFMAVRFYFNIYFWYFFLISFWLSYLFYSCGTLLQIFRQTLDLNNMTNAQSPTSDHFLHEHTPNFLFQQAFLQSHIHHYPRCHNNETHDRVSFLLFAKSCLSLSLMSLSTSYSNLGALFAISRICSILAFSQRTCEAIFNLL